MSEFKKLHFSVREHVNWYDPDTKHTLIADEDNKVIGMVLPKHIHYGELFAAAPDMLEALKRIKETGVFLGAIAQRMMDSAIAKAEGRAEA